MTLIKETVQRLSFHNVQGDELERRKKAIDLEFDKVAKL